MDLLLILVFWVKERLKDPLVLDSYKPHYEMDLSVSWANYINKCLALFCSVLYNLCFFDHLVVNSFFLISVNRFLSGLSNVLIPMCTNLKETVGFKKKKRSGKSEMENKIMARGG